MTLPAFETLEHACRLAGSCRRQRNDFEGNREKGEEKSKRGVSGGQFAGTALEGEEGGVFEKCRQVTPGKEEEGEKGGKKNKKKMSNPDWDVRREEKLIKKRESLISSPKNQGSGIRNQRKAANISKTGQRVNGPIQDLRGKSTKSQEKTRGKGGGEQIENTRGKTN